MTEQEINTRINKRNAWISQLDTIAEQMHADGNIVLSEHLDSVMGELDFQKVQILESNGEAIMERR